MNQLLPLRAVLQRSSLGRSCFYQLISEGRAPRPVHLSERRVAWVESEVDSWLESLISSRKAA